MGTEREIGVRLRVTAQGIEVLDQAGNKIGQVEQKARQSSGAFDELARTAVPGLRTVEAGAVGVAAAVGVGIVGAFAGARAAMSDFFARTDRLENLSQSVGVSARAISSLSLAAKTTGVDITELGQGLKFLNRSIAQAADGSAADAKAFADLGVSIRGSHGEIRQANEVLGDLAARFAGLPDGPQKTALAMQIFSRAGAQLIPVLNLGKEGLDGMREHAERLGLVLSGDTVDAADAVGDKIDILKTSSEGLTNAFATGLLPALSRVVDKTLEWREANDGMLESIASTVGSSLGQFLESSAKDLENIVRIIDTLKNAAHAVDQFSADATNSRTGGEYLNAIKGLGSRLADAGTPPSADITAAIKDARSRGALDSTVTPTILTPVPKTATPGSGDDAAKAAREAEADLEKRTGQTLADQEKVRLALLDAQVSMRARAIKLSEDDLRLAQQSGASQQQQLQIAGQIEELEQKRLIAARDRAQAELDGLLQFGPVVSAEAIKLEDSITGFNEQLARAPDLVAEMTRGFEKSRDVVLDLGKTLNESLQRAVDGFFNSGGIGGGNVVTNTLRAFLSQTIGDSIQAFASGGELKIQGLDTAAQAFNRVGNIFTNLFSGAPSSLATTAVAGAEGSSAVTDAFGALQGFQSLASGAGVSAAGTSGVAAAGAAGGALGGLSAIPVVGVAIGALQAIGEVVKGLKQGFKQAGQKAYQRGASATDLSSTAFSQDPAGQIWSGIFGDKIGGEINYVALTGGFGPILDALGIGLFQPKTTGSIVKREQSILARRAGVPTQRDFEIGGRIGLRTRGIEGAPSDEDRALMESLGFPGGGLIPTPKLREAVQSAATARPEVEAFRGSEALAVGTLTTRTPKEASIAAYTLTNNLLLLGIGTEEARRQMLKLAQTAGIDLVGGLDRLNTQYLQGELTQKQLQSAASGLVTLFSSDLPKAINIDKIVADRTAATGGVNVAGVEAGIRGAVDAYQIRQQVSDSRLGFLDPRQQGTELKRRIAALDKELLDPSLTYAQREDDLKRRADLGFQYVQYAGSRYSGAARKREQAYGYSIAEGSATQLEALGIDNTTATQDNTTAAKDQTAAVKENTAAIKAGYKGTLDVNFKGLPAGEDSQAVIAQINRMLTDFVKSPEFRGSVREAVK